MTISADQPPDSGDYTQQSLPFWAAEASHRERQALLDLALLRVDADLYLSVFCHRVSEATNGGASSSWQQSYQQLASKPRGLCCSVRKARNTVQQAITLGIIAASESVTSAGQQPNSYRINWPGIHQILGIAPPAVPDQTTQEPPGTTCHPHGTTCQGHGTTCHPHGTWCQGSDLPIRNKTSHDSHDNHNNVVVVMNKSLCAELHEEALAIRTRVWGTRHCGRTGTELLLTALVLTRFAGLSPQWLSRACEATNSKLENPGGYLKRCLQNGLAETEGICAPEEVFLVWGRLWKWARPHVKTLWAYITERQAQTAAVCQSGGPPR